MAFQAKASEMGIDGDEDASVDSSGDSSSMDEALDGVEELLPRIKIFVSNVKISCEPDFLLRSS